jgi:type IV secretory pathway TrbL component
MNFEKHIMSYMSQQAEMAQKRHDKKMNLLHTIFFGLNSLNSLSSLSFSSFSSFLKKNSFLLSPDDLFKGDFTNCHKVLDKNENKIAI